MQLKDNKNRRQFLKHLAVAAGGVVLVPYVVSCGTNPPNPDAMAAAAGAAGAPDTKKLTDENVTDMLDAAAVPPTKPEDWDAMAYNKARGATGLIPAAYMEKIMAPDGDNKHMGKHLPFIPTLDAAAVPAGFIAVMWGDPSKGHAKHPNAAKSEAKPDGHWYNWIKIRKAVPTGAEELQSNYTSWPGIGEGDNGAYAVSDGGDITADGGRNTVYLAALPGDVKPGDTVRVWAHCLTHGEYVDFITV